MRATLSTHIEWVEDPESEGLSSLGSVVPSNSMCLYEPIIDTNTGEVVFNNYCSNNKCMKCVPSQIKRIARVGAWSVQDAKYLYLVTVSQVEASTWTTTRDDLLRAARKASGGTVEAFAVVERASQTHMHMLMWSDHPLMTFTRSSVQVKKVKNTYSDAYRVLHYMMKTADTDDLPQLEQHLNLNNGKILWWSRGAFKGFSGFKDARTQYHTQSGWKRGSAPARGLHEDVTAPETVPDEFKQRRTVSKPVRHGVRAAVRRQPRRDPITPTPHQLSEFLDSLTFEDQPSCTTQPYQLPAPLNVNLTRTRPPGHSVEHEEETSQGAQNDPPNPRRERWP